MNLAYAAGFLDGEGNIGFGRCRASVFPRVLIVNTERNVLEAFRSRFGGDIKPLSGRKSNWKQGWVWRLSWSRAVNFLAKLEPHMRIKNRQAHTVFAWDAIRPGRGAKWDQSALGLVTQRMTWLNQKGSVTGQDPIDAIALSVARKYAKRGSHGKKGK